MLMIDTEATTKPTSLTHLKIPHQAFAACAKANLTTDLRGGRSNADIAIVTQAVNIVRKITPASGSFARPSASLSQIAKALDSGAEFDVSEFRSQTIARNKRFKELYASTNNGDSTVTPATLSRFLKCAVIKALSTLQLVGRDSKTMPMTIQNFKASFLQPVYSLFYSQQEASDITNFPGQLSKLLRKARLQVQHHLPLFRSRFTLCDELAMLLIEVTPKGSDYCFAFCYHLAFVCCTGKRVGVTVSNRLEDIIEVVELFGKEGEILTHRHFAVTLELNRRDKNASTSDQSFCTIVGCIDPRDGVLDCVFHLNQLLIHKFNMNLESLRDLIKSKRKDAILKKKLVSYPKKLNINLLLKANLERTTINKKLDLTIHQGRYSAMSKIQRLSEESPDITNARLESLRESLG